MINRPERSGQIGGEMIDSTVLNAVVQAAKPKDEYFENFRISSIEELKPGSLISRDSTVDETTFKVYGRPQYLKNGKLVDHAYPESILISLTEILDFIYAEALKK